MADSGWPIAITTCQLGQLGKLGKEIKFVLDAYPCLIVRLKSQFDGSIMLSTRVVEFSVIQSTCVSVPLRECASAVFVPLVLHRHQDYAY